MPARETMPLRPAIVYMRSRFYARGRSCTVGLADRCWKYLTEKESRNTEEPCPHPPTLVESNVNLDVRFPNRNLNKKFTDGDSEHYSVALRDHEFSTLFSVALLLTAATAATNQ